MKLTQLLKQWAIDTLGVKADASDDAFRTALTNALMGGKLDAAKLAELSDEKAAGNGTPKKGAELVAEIVDAKMAPVLTAVGEMANAVKTLVSVQQAGNPAPAPAAPAPAKGATEEETEEADAATKSLVESLVKSALEARGVQVGTDGDALPVRSVMGLYGATQKARVKSVVEQYSTTKSALIVPMTKGGNRPNMHPMAGLQATYMGTPLDSKSQLDMAVIGAFLKWQFNRCAPKNFMPGGMRMTDHDRDLFIHAVREMSWTGEYLREGQSFEVTERRLNDLEQKTLLDDSTSGGLELAPIVFDQAIIQTPILFGELFPLVDLQTLPRGRRVEGGYILNPTINSGPAEDTPITLETTTGFAGALDTTVYNATGSFKIGLDFSEDTPIAIAQLIVQAYGEKFQEWLDNQIANGDGTTEPTGIFVQSGTTSVNSAMGAVGPATLGDMEQLMFGMGKAVRSQKGGRTVFVSNDTTYRRIRGIPVGSDDARRLQGMAELDYTNMGFPHKIQNDIADGYIAWWNPGYYRMYKRRGLDFRMETAGQTLALANAMLIVCRARFGGRPMFGNSVVKMTDFATVD